MIDNIDIRSLIQNLDAYPPEQQREAAQALLRYINEPRGAARLLAGEKLSDYDRESIIACPYCGSVHANKYGYMRDRVTQRYRCCDCAKTFARHTNTVISRTRKDMSVWEDYILLTLKGESLAVCAKRCNMTISTAFAWRHKILAALAECVGDEVLSNVVEIDETFFRVSYKGNHKKSKNFKMPRPAYRRGSDNRGKMRDRVTVFCAVERGRKAYAEVFCTGAISTRILKSYLPDRFDDDTLILSDGLNVYKSYFASTKLEHRGIPAKQRGKGINHINNVNNFHHRLKEFMGKYNGVSTKYLNNYVSLYTWLDNARLAAKADAHGVATEILKFGSYRPYREFRTWPRTPAA